MIRGKVKKGVVPNVSKTNTKIMRKLHILYGNTRYTDEQIAYFYILWRGNHTQAAIDLGCAPMTMWLRVHQLNSKDMPGLVDRFNGKKKRQQRSDAKVLEEDFILVVNASTSMRQAARILGLNYNGVRMRAKRLGLNTNKGKKGRPKN